MSLPYILFELTLFEQGNDPNDDRTDLGWLLEALVQRDMAYLKANPNTPRLYESGVVYERPAQFGGVSPEVAMMQWALDPEKAKDPRVQAVLRLMQAVFGGERFRDIGVLFERGKGDCDNLATARCAELRQMGIKASPLLIWRRRLDGGYTYHVLVTWPKEFDIGGPGGLREDPSLLLGMGGEERKADRDEEIRKNLERTKLLAKMAGKRGVDLMKIPNVPGLANRPQLPAAPVDPFAGIDGGEL